MGIGFGSGATAEEIVAAVREAVGEALGETFGVATLDRKAGEVAFVEAARQLGAQSRGIPESELAAVDVANPSDRVRAATGLDGVAEASAVVGARHGQLVVPKTQVNGVVVAAARRVLRVDRTPSGNQSLSMNEESA
ncbi:cobalamin biosynthesis protein [Rhodococcus sp. NPDC058521]|uniref:cobalamin biosynthesis protein n=1 Tax=Rhodococcus sp. NPDC058521 TaxID=3346536 RepID=UPI0036479C08